MVRILGASIALMALCAGYTSAAAVGKQASDETIHSPSSTSPRVNLFLQGDTTDHGNQALSLPLVKRGIIDWAKDQWQMSICMGAKIFHDRSRIEKCNKKAAEQGLQMIQNIIDSGNFPMQLMCAKYAAGEKIQIAPDVTKGKGDPEAAVASQIAHGDYSNLVNENTDGNE